MEVLILLRIIIQHSNDDDDDVNNDDEQSLIPVHCGQSPLPSSGGVSIFWNPLNCSSRRTPQTDPEHLHASQFILSTHPTSLSNN